MSNLNILLLASTLEPHTAADIRVDARHFTSIWTRRLLDITHLAFPLDKLVFMLILKKKKEVKMS
jgi:hypothetical protein